MWPCNLVAHLKEEKKLPVDAIIKDRQGGLHHINKALLASKSKFFKSLFCWSPESKEFAVSCDAEGLAASLAWVVTGVVELRQENAVEVMIVAEYLNLLELSIHCQQVRREF